MTKYPEMSLCEENECCPFLTWDCKANYRKSKMLNFNLVSKIRHVTKCETFEIEKCSQKFSSASSIIQKAFLRVVRCNREGLATGGQLLIRFQLQF